MFPPLDIQPCLVSTNVIDGGGLGSGPVTVLDVGGDVEALFGERFDPSCRLAATGEALADDLNSAELGLAVGINAEEDDIAALPPEQPARTAMLLRSARNFSLVTTVLSV
jgi:hypothetical protein